jgi:hypothetical protein
MCKALNSLAKGDVDKEIKLWFPLSIVLLGYLPTHRWCPCRAQPTTQPPTQSVSENTDTSKVVLGMGRHRFLSQEPNLASSHPSRTSKGKGFSRFSFEGMQLEGRVGHLAEFCPQAWLGKLLVGVKVAFCHH